MDEQWCYYEVGVVFKHVDVFGYHTTLVFLCGLVSRVWNPVKPKVWVLRTAQKFSHCILRICHLTLHWSLSWYTTVFLFPKQERLQLASRL